MTEQQRPVLLLLIGIVCLSVAPAPAADARKGTVQVEAVVQRYEEDVMWEHFDDDRFAAYDAVTLKMVTPADMANKTIRVYFEFRSIKDNSPMQKPGQRCRFDFDKNLLKEDWLFPGALENLEWIKQPARPKVRSTRECRP